MTPTREELIKHDYAKALADIFGPSQQTSGDMHAQFIELSSRIASHSDTIRHALKLAQLVTGEPIEGMVEKGHDDLCQTFDMSESDGEEECKFIETVFKAMITQAIREVEE